MLQTLICCLQIRKVQYSKYNNIIVSAPKKQDAPDEQKPHDKEQRYSPSEFELQCVDYLIQSILNDFPNQKVPKTEAEKKKWAIHINRMQKIDHIDMKTIWNTLVWTMQDGFWRTNIRSTAKFREKFQTLYLQSRRNNRNQNKNVFNDFEQNKYDFAKLESELLSN